MAEFFGATVEDVFKTQDARFRAEDAKGVDAVVAYDITGEGGGRWRVTVRDSRAVTEKVTGSDFGAFTTKITTDAETFIGVTVGKIDGTAAFTSGRVKIEGDMKIVALLPRLFTKYSPPSRGVSARDIIATFPERFRPEAAKGLDAAIGYNLAGEGGGQWTAVVKDGRLEMREGLAENLTVNQTVGARDYVDLMLGKLDPMVAIGAGRLRITGDMEVAKVLPKLFRKYEPKEVERGPELIVLKKTISVGMRFSTGPVMGRFLEGLKGRKIFANVCPSCGRRQLPPREVCAVCRCRAGEFVEVGPEGVLVNVEICYYASPDPLTGETRETPYGTSNILLDGCRGTETFWHYIKREDLFDVKRGSRVRPVWAESRTGSVHDIKYFEMVR
ncbi:MAG: SCP2 sterol-binding domain-containing protein [bacterium]